MPGLIGTGTTSLRQCRLEVLEQCNIRAGVMLDSRDKVPRRKTSDQCTS